MSRLRPPDAAERDGATRLPRPRRRGSPLLPTVLRTIREHGLMAAGDRVLVALSGGPDSTALLHLLLRLRGQLSITVEAATVDHGLRPEAEAESALVAARCQTLSIPCARLKVDVQAARGPHVSLQDAARRVRLGALEEAARARGCARVALGHSADDQAETVLFRVVRGTGLGGLAAMAPRRGLFVRPLLEVRRADLLHYLDRRGIDYLQDPSNLDRRFTRARIRHDWIPFLARENPRVVEALLALARAARAAAGPGGAGAVPARPTIPRLSRGAAATVTRLAALGAGTRTVAAHGGVVEVSYGRVTWRAGSGVTPAATATPGAVTEIIGPGLYWLAGGGPAPHGADAPAGAGDGLPDALHDPGVPLGLQIEEGTGSGGWSAAAVFDRDRVALPLRLRAPRPGDRMRPRGGRGRRKLSDLLIDAKVPRARRPTLPVLEAADGTILFVAGLRPAATGAPDANTRRWIQVRVHHSQEPSEPGKGLGTFVDANSFGVNTFESPSKKGY